MREIKFRCWDKQYKEMADVTAWLLLTNEIDHSKNNGEPKLVEHFEIMQYTGLKDKNGKDVFEGDVLRITSWSTTFKVVWDDYYAKFTVVKIESDLGRKLDYIPSEECEIIGNIYENPELLK